MAPDSRRSESRGSLDSRISGWRESCEIATTGTRSSRASALRPRLISDTSWTRFASRERGRGLHELEVVHDHEIKADLRLQPAGLGPELHRADVRRVVDVDGRFGEAGHGLGDAHEVHLVEEAGPQALAVDVPDRAEQPQDQLFLAHLQAEDPDALAGRVADRRELGDVEREARLAHRRPRGDHDEVGRLEAGGQRVEVRESGPDAADLAAVRMQVVEPVERLVEERPERAEARRNAALGHREELRFRAVDRLLDLRPVLVPDPGDLAGSRDQVAQDSLALDDPGVLAGEDGSGRLLGERREVGPAADLLEVAAALQRLRDGDDVDRLATLPQLEHRGVDAAVGLPVEVVRPDDVGHLDDRVAVDEERAEDRLFGFDALRRKAIEGHADSELGAGPVNGGGLPPRPPAGCPRVRGDIPNRTCGMGAARGYPVDGCGWPACQISRQARPSARRRSIEAADHPDELALDPYRVVVLRRIGRVGRLEPHAPVLLEEPLERDGVLLHLGDDDVTVAGGLLGPDHDVVTVRDERLDHRIPSDPEEVGVPRGGQHLRHGLVVPDHLVGLDRTARGDLTDHGEHVRLASRRLGRHLARKPEGEGSLRRETEHPALGGAAALQVAILLERLEVVMDGRGGGEADGASDLADRRGDAGRPEHRRDVVQDLPLPFRVVLGHASSFPALRRILPNVRSIVKVGRPGWRLPGPDSGHSALSRPGLRDRRS